MMIRRATSPVFAVTSRPSSSSSSSSSLLPAVFQLCGDHHSAPSGSSLRTVSYHYVSASPLLLPLSHRQQQPLQQRRSHFTVAYTEQHPVLTHSAEYHEYSSNMWVDAGELEKFVLPRLGLAASDCQPKPGELPTRILLKRRCEYWNTADIENAPTNLPIVHSPRWVRNGCPITNPLLVKVLMDATHASQSRAADIRQQQQKMIDGGTTDADHHHTTRRSSSCGWEKTHWWIPDWDINKHGYRIRQFRVAQDSNLAHQLGAGARMQVEPVVVLEDRPCVLYNACQFNRPEILAHIPVIGLSSEYYFKYLRQLFNKFEYEKKSSGLVFTPRMISHFNLDVDPAAEPIQLDASAVEGLPEDVAMYNLDQIINADEVRRVCAITDADELGCYVKSGENLGLHLQPMSNADSDDHHNTNENEHEEEQNAFILPSGTRAWRLPPGATEGRRSKYWIYSNRLAFSGIICRVKDGELPLKLGPIGDPSTAMKGRVLPLVSITDLVNPEQGYIKAGTLRAHEIDIVKYGRDHTRRAQPLMTDHDHDDCDDVDDGDDGKKTDGEVGGDNKMTLSVQH